MKKKQNEQLFETKYQHFLAELSELIETSRKTADNSINEIMVDTYSKCGVEIPTIEEPYLFNSSAVKFLGLKDEFEGKSLKECYLILLEDFFLKNSFAVVSKQKEFQIGDEWYRVDLVLFNRRLKCLVIIDLKLGKLTHADIGQMLLYTGYADEHWREGGENPPVGLILCDQKNDALAHYTLENLPNKVLASEYKMVLPDEKILVEKIRQAKKLLSARLT